MKEIDVLFLYLYLHGNTSKDEAVKKNLSFIYSANFSYQEMRFPGFDEKAIIMLQGRKLKFSML